MRDHIAFFRQFRSRFQTTGAIAPSSRFLAGAMTGPLKLHKGPARILEVGPGTGAVTRRIVQLLEPEDRLDLVELNETFAERLSRRFEVEPIFQKSAGRSNIHVCPLEEFESEAAYDFIISGLPLNNFASETVREIFEIYFRLLAPGGVLSYFEYMYVRPLRKLLVRGGERTRLETLDEIMNSFLTQYRFHKSWVFVNIPPAWVQHLRNEKDGDQA